MKHQPAECAFLSAVGGIGAQSVSDRGRSRVPGPRGAVGVHQVHLRHRHLVPWVHLAWHGRVFSPSQQVTLLDRSELYRTSAQMCCVLSASGRARSSHFSSRFRLGVVHIPFSSWTHRTSLASDPTHVSYDDWRCSIVNPWQPESCDRWNLCKDRGHD